MTSENAFWAIVWVCISSMTITLGFVGKSCNESDNRFYTDAVLKGCSVLSCHNGHKVVCNREQEARCE